MTGANDAMGNPPRIENGMTLQFRNPTDAEQKTLDMQTAALGFDVPWIQRDHVHIEMTYQVTYTPLPSRVRTTIRTTSRNSPSASTAPTSTPSTTRTSWR